MVTVEDFSRLVSGIYAAAVTPQQWGVALAEISRMLDASGCGLITGEGPSRSVMIATVPPDARKVYTEYYHAIDYVLDAVEKGPAGLIRGGRALVALKTQSEFEADFMRRFEMDDGMFLRLNAGTTPTSFLVAAPKGSEPFDTAERVELLSALVPHLQQALRAHNKLTTLARSNADLAAALETVRHGIIIVGSDGGVINLNTAAERILRADDGLKMWSGRLAVTSTTAEHQLQRALHAALTDHGSTIRGGRSFACERSSGIRPYVVHVLPLHHTATDEISSDAKALVLIVDPDQEPEPAAALVRRLYGLTVTEADVAVRIACGVGLQEISDELSVSIATVRKHLQHVFDKTDTHRQAELVRLLLTLRP
jgi:DNA-binding CsgD family transcriptional regulator/PAS domain-containing protein